MPNSAAQKVAVRVPPLRRRSGRPTAKQVAEIDAAIRIAARQSFVDVGFEAASMDAIAAIAQVSKGTLYARYRSKEALFRAVLEDLLEQISVRAGGQDHLLPDDLETRLRHFGRVLTSVFGWPEYVQATRLVLNAGHAFPEIAEIWQEQGTRRYVGLIAENIARSGELPPDGRVDPVFLANLFLHGLAGWYRSESSNGPVNEAETAVYCDNVIAAIMTTIRASGQPVLGMKDAQ